MPITITTTKPKAKPAPVQDVALEATEPSEMTFKELADLYGTLQDQVAALSQNPIFARLDEVTKALVTRVSDSAEATETMTIKGKHWQVEVGACAKAPRKITDTLAVLKMIGNDAFAAIAKVGVSDAEKYLTPDQFATVVSDEAFTSNRKIKPTFLG